MNVFDLRNAIVNDYARFIRGFVKIKDPAIKDKVDEELNDGLLWPEPIVQLSPAFEQGESIDDLVKQDVLCSGSAENFTREGKPLRLYKHQSEALKKARAGKNYVLTTGTGSGKSLTYIIPIVDHILRTGTGEGVKAIVVYPMNALANSQLQELEKFPDPRNPDNERLFTFERYTGQETEEKKDEIRKNPPDIILTNYVMLELLLTRADELEIVKNMKNLRFIVLDELHTYRGRQGADVAMLVRRTREASGSKSVLCVGTSATLASGSTRKEQAEGVAKTASTLFGAHVDPDDVVNEYLVRETNELNVDDPTVQERLRAEIEFLRSHDDDGKLNESFRAYFGASDDYEALKQSALCSWIESTFGVRREQESGALIRQKPTTITGDGGGAERLAQTLGLGEIQCAKALQRLFMLGYRVKNSIGRPFFSFRLHQFISRGDHVYATAELGENRRIFMRKQIFAPGENREKKIYPLVFCRHCGQEFYSVTRVADITGVRFDARDPFDEQDLTDVEKQDVGFLYASATNPWPENDEEIAERLPDDWLDNQGKVLHSRDKRLPERYRINPFGLVVSSDEKGFDVAFIHSPFLFCPECGASYSAMSFKKTKQDFQHLGGVSAGGRAIATTILSLSAVNRLREIPRDELNEKARKLLSFTDNRQDASFQAGHFNDFVEVSVLRGALYRGLQQAGNQGLNYKEAAIAVVDALDLDESEYAKNPGKKGSASRKAHDQLKEAVCFRLMTDLQRGVRLQVPNLEQTGLLKIEYSDLDDLVCDEKEWASKHPALAQADPETRKKALLTVLHELRRSLVVNYENMQEKNKWEFLKNTKDRLKTPWGFDDSVETDNLPSASVAYLCSKKEGKNRRTDVYISSRSSLGLHLRRAAFPKYGAELKLEDSKRLLDDIFDAFDSYGLVEKSESKDGLVGYQLDVDCMRWKLGDGTVEHYDPVRQPGESKEQNVANEFYQDYYRELAANLGDVKAREHTAQVPTDKREEREEDFRKGELPVLFCSPTMELGVDISELNVVHMRNIPPTPANYAQRSGRAGRSGQPALILSYCTSGNQHDQYFFQRPDQMVSGAVQTPRVDLSNERLIRSHVQAIWLAEAAKKLQFSLGASLRHVLNIEDVDQDSGVPKCELREQVVDALRDKEIKERAEYHARRVLSETEEELKKADWYGDEWLNSVMNQLQATFDDACERWRSLYQGAQYQRNLQFRIQGDASRSSTEREKADKLRAQAVSEITLLEDTKNPNKSEFYSYRYFASEGFLPGYNFPRLPVTAFLPGVRGKNGEDDYLSRPRFLAINEFGPRAIIYHEGARFEVDQITLPASGTLSKEGKISLKGARVCPKCGYYHATTELADVCAFCGSPLAGSLDNLVEFKNVTARRRDRINCDEEERRRYGYDLTTSFKFSERNDVQSRRRAEIFVVDDGERLKWGELVYAPSATIYRINNGYRRSSPENRNGFLLDVERGQWVSKPKEDDTDSEEYSPNDRPTRLARPYVEDTKNCLLIKPSEELPAERFASLQSALRCSIERLYSLEELELSTFALPNDSDRKILFFYEASEGGAGVLQDLLAPNAFQEVVCEALRICHFDPDSGADLGKAEHATEPCDAACYDCLLSYSNQRDHKILDRQAIKELLLQLRDAELVVSPGPATREEHLNALKKSAESELERKWLERVDALKCKLPSRAQVYIEAADARPDFVYDDEKVAIYVDGPPHDYDDAIKNDKAKEDALMTIGWGFIRFRHDEDWDKILQENAQLFGLKQ